MNLSNSGLPSELWERAAWLVDNECFDAGNYVSFADISDEDTRQPLALAALNDIPKHSCVFLIDHMWSTTFPQARSQLIDSSDLRNRMASILDASREWSAEEIWDNMWHLLCCSDEYDKNDSYSHWYVMDEVGCAIRHSESPNLKCVPLYCEKLGGYVTVAWPLKDIEEGELITRDFLDRFPSGPNKDLRCLMLDMDLMNKKESLQEWCDDNDEQMKCLMNQDLTSVDASTIDLADISLPIEFQESWNSVVENLNRKKAQNIPLRVFCDRKDHLNSTILSSSKFELVATAEDADILYLIDHTYANEFGMDCEYDKRNKMLNQFWWEGMLVTKDQLTYTVKKTHAVFNDDESHCYMNEENFPAWYPVTYDLERPLELVSFLRKNVDSESVNSSTVWILKKYQGKQSVDYPITRNFPCIIKHLDSCPRLASRYVMNPMTLQGRKFDLRCYVLVKSLEPLILQRHSFFIIRWSNRPYQADQFEDYQTHFTVMNFLEDAEMSEVRGHGHRQDIHCKEFIRVFDDEYGPEITWKHNMEPRLNAMIRDIFTMVQRGFGPLASHPSKQSIHPNAGWSLNQPNVTTSRAMYGIDVLFTENCQPMVMEVQWAPDCEKAVELMPNFWDTILEALYLDEHEHVVDI